MRTQASRDLESRLQLTPFWNMLLSFLFICHLMFIFTTQNKDIHARFIRKDNLIFSLFISWFPNLSNCNTWTWCSDFVVNVILRFQIDGSDRGSNFYETKFMDSSRWKENREI